MKRMHFIFKDRLYRSPAFFFGQNDRERKDWGGGGEGCDGQKGI